VSFFEAANAWISSNQALVASVGIPAFTLLITAWASFLSHRGKAAEIKLNGHLKLSEYRRANYDELLRLSSRLQTLFVQASASTKFQGKKPVDDNPEALLETIECANQFLLRASATQQQADQFAESMHTCSIAIFHLNGDIGAGRNILGELRLVCKAILDDEWTRIERELKVLSK
jgi:hypothetical protein